MKMHFITLAVLLVSVAAMAKPNPEAHKVVFEVVSKESADWEAVLNNIENLQKAFGAGTTQIEVVAHGGGLGLLRKTNTAMAERLERIAKTGVVFAACNNTMRRMKVTKEDLLPFVTVVDSGVAEIVRKQEAGWSYIKAGL